MPNLFSLVQQHFFLPACLGKANTGNCEYEDAGAIHVVGE
jgi:hypothetical protein